MKIWNTAITLISAIITVISAIITVYAAVATSRAEKELKESTQRIEVLVSKMDSAVVRIEAVSNRTEPVIHRIHNLTSELISKKKQESLKRQNDPAPVVSQVENYWKTGIDLLNKKEYKEAIAQFRKVINEDSRFEKEAYFHIAIAYARLSRGNYTDREQELYRNTMMDYLKKSARMGQEESQELLQKYGESW
jgi:TolA-binding protein